MKQKKTAETLKEEDREKIAKLVKSGFIFTAKARVRCLRFRLRSRQRHVFFIKKGLQVTGLDLSKIAIKQISEKAKNKNLLIETICSNVSNYKIKNNKYDIIIGIDILQYPNFESCISGLQPNVST